MAMKVNRAFSEFFNDVVNISKIESDNAKKSRDYLISQIVNISNNGKFLRLASQYNCFFGSFSRKTKVCVLNDVDLIIGLNGCDLLCEGYKWDKITLKLKKNCSDKRLINLSDNISMFSWQEPDYELNSNKVKNNLVSELKNISQYEKAEIHARGEAITLKLKSYAWNFDIVPAFYYEENNKSYFIIPNGNGKWKKTNPIIEQKRIANANSKFNNTVLQTVRLVKYWNMRGRMPNITSYVLETMVLDYFDSAKHYCINQDGSTTDYPNVHFRDALYYISNNIYSNVYDSKGIQGNINDLSLNEKNRIHQRAKTDYEKAKNAVNAEINEKNHQKSINIWRDIFGEEFPKYE